MRLVTFRAGDAAPRAGRLDGDTVIPLAAASTLEWLRGVGREDDGEPLELDAVELLSPLPEPPAIRDFFAFEGHVATGWRLRGGEIPAAWYELPVFYFSNPASIHGPADPVHRPHGCEWLDFELEVAAVVGPDQEIAGFTLFNDWSARDLQRKEMTVGLGPAKGKDFAITLGPWIATPEELDFREGVLHTTASVTLNGELLTAGPTAAMHWTWPQVVAHAARDTRLRPGDLLGSGTLNEGCLLELNANGRFGETPRWLQDGDTVTVAAEGLGEVTTRIVG